MTMFDLHPDVDHLMLDRELGEAFDRAAITARRAETIDRSIRVRGPLDRARHALGTRLIAAGTALTVEERGVRTSVAR